MRTNTGGVGPIDASPEAAGEGALVTFDVFDTLITRAVARPSDVFLLLGHCLADAGLLASHSPHAFASARELADRRAHANGGGREAGVDLRTIWCELSSALVLPRELVDDFVDEELQLEASVLRAVTPGVRQLERARRTSRVALLSDTYLTRRQLHELLIGCGVEVDLHEIFTSSDQRATKVSGKLFEVVLGELDPLPTNVLHLGDDERADIVGARSAGVRALPMGLARNTRYEAAVARHATSSDGLASSLAGASRLARIAMSSDSEHSTPIVDVAAGVAGPLLVSHALWLLQRARDEGVERLYFLSRDGQVMREICRRIGPSLGWSDDQLRYLYVSRASVTAPIMLDEPALRPWVWTHLESASADDVLERVGIRSADLDEELRRLGIDDPSATLDHGRRAELQRSLESGTGRAALSAQLTPQRDLALRYLTQEGFFEDLTVGVVDLGGRGSQFQALAAARRSHGVRPPIGLYGFLIAPSGPPLHPEHEHAWLFDERRALGLRRFPGLVSMLEAFCAADHGSVRSYAEASGSVVPCLADPGPRSEWARGAMRATILHATDELSFGPSPVNLRADTRAAVMDAVQLFWFDPEPEEVAAWASFPVEERGGVAPLARPASPREAASFVAGRGWPGDWWEWPAGCIELGPRRVRAWRMLAEDDSRGRVAAGLATRARRLLSRAAELR